MELVDSIDYFLHQPRPQPHQLTQFRGRRLRQAGRSPAFLRAKAGDLQVVDAIGLGPRQLFAGKSDGCAAG